MSVTTRSPLRMAGAALFSGGINTGEFAVTFGGSLVASVYSGQASGGIFASPLSGLVTNGTAPGGNFLLFIGAGRLASILQLTQMISGQAATFYDSAVATSGGPFQLSGHKIVGILPPTWPAAFTAASGLGNNPTIFDGRPINTDVPFQSGLCVATASGVPGFSVTIAPEINPAIG